jgi:hypothetical protein
MGNIDQAEIDRRFTHRAPGPERTGLHEEVRDVYKAAGGELSDLLPESREKSLAITALEESGFWAQAAIARNVKEDGED